MNLDWIYAPLTLQIMYGVVVVVSVMMFIDAAFEFRKWWQLRKTKRVLCGIGDRR